MVATNRNVRFRHHLAPAIVVAVGLILSGFLFALVRDQQNEFRHAEFERRASSYSSAIDKELYTLVEFVENVARLFTAFPSVGRSDFNAFVSGEHHHAQAVQWVPRVLEVDRSAFEAAARDGGLEGFQFTEISSRNTIAPAARRPEYHPVYYVEPLEGNERSLGLDLGANPERRAAFEMARDSGEPRFSAPLTLVQETGSQIGLLVFAPVFESGAPTEYITDRRESIRGYALGVFRAGDFVANAMGRMDSEASSLNVRLVDRSNPGSGQVLTEIGDPGTTNATAISWVTTSVDAPGRAWVLEISPNSDFLSSYSTRASWGVLLGGLILTGVAGFFSFARIRGAEARDSILQSRFEAEQRLAAVLDVSQDAIIQTDSAMRILRFNHGAEVTFGYDANEVLGQSFEMLLPPRLHSSYHGHLEQLARSSLASLRLDGGGTCFGIRKNGTEFGAEGSITKSESGGETTFTVFLRDITERRLAEHQLSQRAKELAVRAGIAEALGVAGKFEEKALQALKLVCAAAEATSATFRVVDAEDQRLMLIAVIDVPGAPLKHRNIIEFDDSTSGVVANSGKPIIRNAEAPQDTSETLRKMRSQSGTWSRATFPVKAAGQALATVSLRHQQTGHFTEDRVRLISAAIEGLGPLLEQARLTQNLASELERRETAESQLRVHAVQVDMLFTMAKLLAASDAPLDRKLEMVVAKISEAVEADEGYLRIPEGDALVMAAGYGDREHNHYIRLDDEKKLASAAARTQQIQMFNDLESQPKPRAIAGSQPAAYQSAIALPVLLSGAVVAVLGFRSEAPDHFTPDRVNLMMAIADSIGLFFQQAALLEMEQLQGGELGALYNIARTLVQPLPSNQRTTAVLSQLVQSVGLEFADLWMPQPDGTILMNATSGDFAGLHRFDAKPDGLVVRCARSREITISNQYGLSPDAHPMMADAGSLAAFPVPLADGTCSVVVVAATEKDYFTTQRTRSIGALVAALGVLLENAQLQEQVTIERGLQHGKDTFIAVASHELRTPMTSILGFSDLLLKGTLLEADRTDALQRIYRATNRLSGIVDNLLSATAIARNEASNSYLPLDVGVIMADVTATIVREETPHVISVDIDGAPDPFVGDADKIMQTIINLMDNAIKYSPAGGEIKISVGSNDNDSLLISVSDEGIGISKREQKAIFGPFHRIRGESGNAIPGTGLGLHIVRELVTAMDGKIWVESESGKGSTFFVSLANHATDVHPESGPSDN